MLPSAVGQCVAALVVAHGLDRMPEAHSTQCRGSCLISIRNARHEGVVLFEKSLPSLHARSMGWSTYCSTACFLLSSRTAVEPYGAEHRAPETWR